MSFRNFKYLYPILNRKIKINHFVTLSITKYYWQKFEQNERTFLLHFKQLSSHQYNSIRFPLMYKTQSLLLLLSAFKVIT